MRFVQRLFLRRKRRVRSASRAATPCQGQVGRRAGVVAVDAGRGGWPRGHAATGRVALTAGVKGLGC
jgi:hypothetical protein